MAQSVLGLYAIRPQNMKWGVCWPSLCAGCWGCWVTRPCLPACGSRHLLSCRVTCHEVGEERESDMPKNRSSATKPPFVYLVSKYVSYSEYDTTALFMLQQYTLPGNSGIVCGESPCFSAQQLSCSGVFSAAAAALVIHPASSTRAEMGVLGPHF